MDDPEWRNHHRNDFWVFGSLLATWIYGKVQTEAWKKDFLPVGASLDTMNARLASASEEVQCLRTAADAASAQLATIRIEHDALLKGIVPAIGGSFTKSLFAFHPMASQQIAKILSVETDRQYQRHHKRVIVTSARDTYLIKGLTYITPNETTPVWSLEFHVMWEWLNDSRVAKNPLDDFLLVAVANEEALDDFDHKSEADRLANRDRLAHYLRDRHNIVRSTIANPLDPTKRIPAAAMASIFKIDRIDIRHNGATQEIDAAQLLPVPSVDLPVGIYSAFSLPKLNIPLPVDARLVVEYVGQICLPAESEDGNEYWGYMTFPPSDVIGNQYDLSLLYPPTVSVSDRTFDVAVVAEQSGCQFIHDPLRNHPVVRQQTAADVPMGLKSKAGQIAQIRVTEPLTDLHRFELTWKARARTGTVSSRRRLAANPMDGLA